MGEARSAYGGEGRRIQYFGGGNLMERDHLGDTCVGGSKMLRWIFRKWDVGVWNGLSYLRIGTVGGDFMDRAGSG
jgi:hypothetical protein